MRKFRFVGDETEASLYDWDVKPEQGKIYNGDFKWTSNGVIGEELQNLFHLHPNDWEEVFDEPTKPLHKDTDLGYFAGLAMQGYISAGSTGMPNPEIIVELAMKTAKELIKQLDKETK